MPIDPNIALGVRPINLESPLEQYAKIAQIQHFQNQNAMSKYQLGKAERDEAVDNALSKAYAESIDPATGEINANMLRTKLAQGGAGSKLPAVEKSLSEAKLAQIKMSKEQSDLLDAKLKQSRQFLETIDPNSPDAAQQYLAWHQANHADPVLGPTLAARGVTPQQSLGQIQQAVQTGTLPQLIQKSMLGIDKFTELNKPTIHMQDGGGFGQAIQIPGLGGQATVVPGSTIKKTATPGEVLSHQDRMTRLSQETATGNLSPDTTDLLAQTYLQTGQLPPMGMGKNAAAMRQQVFERAAQLGMANGASAADAAGNIRSAKMDTAANASALRDFSSGVSARKVTANNTAINHLATMEKLATDLSNNNVGVFNAAANAFAKATGATAPSNFDAAKQLVANEVIKAVVANGGSMADRQEAADNFSKARSPAQLRGVINTYKNLLGGQLSSLGNQYEIGTGRKDFTKRLTPATQRILEQTSAISTPAVNIPTPGSIVKGYKFKGGDPSDKNNWEKQ